MAPTPGCNERASLPTHTRTARSDIVTGICCGLGLLGVFVLSLIGVLFDAPTIDVDSTPPAVFGSHGVAYPYRTKTILNAGGLGLLYWEGAQCLVDLRATFTPLGTLGSEPVARYDPTTTWWTWHQCPQGTLVTMDPHALATWRADRAREVAAAQARQHALDALTTKAKEY